MSDDRKRVSLACDRETDKITNYIHKLDEDVREDPSGGRGYAHTMTKMVKRGLSIIEVNVQSKLFQCIYINLH